MSHNSNQYLKLCQELKHKGIEFDIEPGVRLARGYADLGFEEYYLLSENRLLSIYLGTQTEYLPEQSAFFFVVPDTDDLLALALEQGLDAGSLRFNSDFQWTYQQKSAESLNELLIDFILSRVRR